MSLLMDALRKAEEAKKKAAQEAKSEDAAATVDVQEQRASTADEKIPEDSSSPEIELSMADMEEVPTRSAVPNLETPIEFEDEEDYVLPTSVGSPPKSEVDLEEAESGDEQIVGDSLEDEPDAEEEAPAIESAEPQWDADSTTAEPDSPTVVEPAPIPESIQHDDLEDEEMGQPESLEEEEMSIPQRAEAERIQTPIPPANVGNAVRPTARGTGVARDESGQRTARNVFAAKKSPALSRRNIQIAAGGGLFIVLVAIGTYFYISLNQESAFNIPAGSYVASDYVDDGQLVSDLVAQAEPIDESTAADADPSGLANLDTANDIAADSSVLEEFLSDSEFPEVVAVAEPSPSAADIQPETIVVETPQPGVVVTTVDDDPVAIAEEEAETEAVIAASPEPAQTIASESVQPTATSEPANLISFRRQANVVTVDPNLDRAYAAYQQGSLDEAEELYRRALASDPLQRDALLGLATIAARSGNSAEALDLYSRMLARNPRDPIARAGLMEILPAGSAANQEADLKRLLNDYPNIAPLAYAYGNFLASNQRWSEAQQAYFRALQLAKSDAALNGRVNPDYAFNLAVSLEHLNQSQPAQNYYREALAFAANHPAGFDLAAVRSRLASMAGEQ